MSKINFHFANKEMPELAKKIQAEINEKLGRNKSFSKADWNLDVEYQGQHHTRLSMPPEDLRNNKHMMLSIMYVVNKIRSKYAQ